MDTKTWKQQRVFVFGIVHRFPNCFHHPIAQDPNYLARSGTHEQPGTTPDPRVPGRRSGGLASPHTLCNTDRSTILHILEYEWVIGQIFVGGWSPSLKSDHDRGEEKNSNLKYNKWKLAVFTGFRGFVNLCNKLTI